MEKFEYLLRLGDNALILCQRLGEWCGHGPILEEDMALTNVALDLLGQARMWLTLAAEVEGAGRDEDQLAYLRDAGGFRNLLLVEQPNGSFAETITRQFYFDNFHYLQLKSLSRSMTHVPAWGSGGPHAGACVSGARGARVPALLQPGPAAALGPAPTFDPRVAEIAAKALKEVTYHLQRSSEWMIRLGDGTPESHQRMQAAVDSLWAYTGEMFDTDDVDRAQGHAGVDPATLRAPWLAHLQAVFAQATLTMPTATWMQRGGKSGIHGEHLGYVLAEMQFLQRAYPGATW